MGLKEIQKLKNRKLVKRAIMDDQCILCGGNRVNTDGLCSSCFMSLDERERKIANEESSHKHIFKIVIDDRDSCEMSKEEFIKAYYRAERRFY